MSVKKSVGRVKAREACVIEVGGSPVEWHRRIVRDNHTGKLVEIDVHEFGPKVPEKLGTPYVFKANEEVEADHPAVLDCPNLFVAVED